jgi:outer membrane lipoprotein-sorting protein
MEDIRGSVRRYAPLVAALLVVAATGVVGASLTAQPSGEEILDSVEQRYDSAGNVVGTAEVVAVNDTDRYTATVEYVVTADNESRVTVAADGETVVAGSDGSNAWVYDPATGLARTYDEAAVEDRAAEWRADHPSYEKLRDRYGDNVSVTRAGTATVGGTETYVLDVTSANESIDAEGTLWVDRADSTVEKATVTDEDGTVTVRFTETRFDVSVHDSTFRPPTDGGDGVPGAERESYDDFAAAQSATDLSLPDLRGDYEFEQAVVAAFDGERTATAVYDTPKGTAYVAVTTADRAPEGGERRTVAGREVTVAGSDRGTVAYWTDDGVTTAVVVRGPESTALEVAGTVLS